QVLPFIAIVSNSPRYGLYQFADERSAAFFALGRARSTGRPVAVITTSGTAVAELLPATIEAYYTAIPLILVTGDKSRNNRGTGAPQCIEQINIFGQYVSECIDLQKSEPLNLRGRVKK